MDYCDILSSIWTLILTAPIHCRLEDPVVSKGLNVKFLQFSSEEETNSSTSGMT